MNLLFKSRKKQMPLDGHGDLVPMNKTLLVLTLALTVTVTACGNTTEQPNAAPPAGDTAASTPAAPAQHVDRGAVAARVNGTPIYKIDYDTALASFKQSNNIGPDTPPEKLKEIDKVVMDGLI